MQSVGGLGEVLAELRDLVALPLKRPDWLAKLGLEPPRGVLLVGPPGTGKTLTVRALAAELGVNYIAIAGSEIIGKYYGEAELRLRQVFQKAANSAPCLIFIAEIDSLAPERSKVEGEVEKRDLQLKVDLPDITSRFEILRVHNRDRPLAEDVNLISRNSPSLYRVGMDSAVMTKPSLTDGEAEREDV